MVFQLPEEFSLEAIRAGFQAYMESIPEFDPAWHPTPLARKTSGDAKVEARLCAGSFGALNFASAYHVPFARQIDAEMKRICSSILSPLATKRGLRYFEILPDRLCFRPRGDTLGGESMHRDLSGGLSTTDLCFGSFVNLNRTGDQHLTIEKGTQLWTSDGKSTGYTSVSNPVIKARFKANKTTMCVPPGHGCIFFESALHEVKAGVVGRDCLRKFVGMRLTNDHTPWCPENAQRRIDQAPMVHKGGQTAPMYPKLYTVNHKEKLRLYTMRFNRRLGALFEGEGRLKRVPPSLRQLGHMYPAYTASELDVYTPTPI